MLEIRELGEMPDNIMEEIEALQEKVFAFLTEIFAGKSNTTMMGVMQIVHAHLIAAAISRTGGKIEDAKQECDILYSNILHIISESGDGIQKPE